MLEKKETTKIDENKIIVKNKALISLFAGSRISEINILMPILLNFIKLMNNKFSDFVYIFHTTKDHSFLLEGDVFTKDNIETYISYKRENEVAPMDLKPHPHEFNLYYDA